MAKTKPPKTQPVHIEPIQRDPNTCFVLFSSTFFTADNVYVGLQSLATQLQRIERDRNVKRMEYLAAERKLIVEFEDQLNV
ncbi:hypothetical protein P4V33_09350 [Brevibacillus borstelensis]|uniref:hypothetical protein n=1 Tax=Brevibacillus borstelensis TaxID=45462 RepID=UPI002E210EFB|nr:hypothetical protein [Brevibacillus borstelensis]